MEKMLAMLELNTAHLKEEDDIILTSPLPTFPSYDLASPRVLMQTS